MSNPLHLAIEQAGSQTALAKQIGVSPQAVQQWATKGRPPVHRCVAIEKATAGRVTRYALRPDIFGIPPDGSL